MKVLIITVFLLASAILGWFTGSAISILNKPENGRKGWIGWVIFIASITYAFTAAEIQDYSWKHREYDSSKYEIVRDTTITNHNGQIDTSATFKIVKL